MNRVVIDFTYTLNGEVFKKNTKLPPKERPSPNGVRASVLIYSDNQPEKVVEQSLGASRCHPTDNFCKSIGRKLALKNAISHMPRAIRRQVWEEYFNLCKR